MAPKVLRPCDMEFVMLRPYMPACLLLLVNLPKSSSSLPVPFFLALAYANLGPLIAQRTRALKPYASSLYRQ